MYLQKDRLTVRVGKIIAESHTTNNPAFILDPDAISGWYEGVSTRRDITQRALAWGDFPERAYKGSRVITISGTAVARTPQELHGMRDIFMATMRHGGFEEMSVQNLSGTRFAKVSLEGPTAWLQLSDTVAAWRMELYADDPRIYGPIITTTISENSVTGGVDYPQDYPMNYNTPLANQAANISIGNNGNTDAYPVFSIRGDFYSGFTISDGGVNSVVFTGVVGKSAPVVIDMATGTATQGGVDRSSFLSRRGFFSVPPLGTIYPTFTPLASGTGWCDIMYRDTWI